MSGETREQVLADFIECTGLENVEECIAILEQHQWNLLNAVQVVHERLGGSSEMNYESAVPKHSTLASSHRSTTTTIKPPTVVRKINHTSTIHKRQSDSDDNIDSDEPRIIRSLPGAPKAIKTTAGAAKSRGPVRELNFHVEYKDQTELITMHDNETIHQLQLKISDKLHVSPSRQHFTNWPAKTCDDQTILKDLNLPKENNIHLLQNSTSISNGASRTLSTTLANAKINRHPATSPKTASSTTTTNAHFPITVVYEDKPGKSTPYNLLLKPTATVADMKNEIEHTIHIPVCQQSWTGLFGAQDKDQLRQTLINRKANLIVRKQGPSSSSSSASNQKPLSNKTDSKHSTMIKHTSEDDTMDIDHVIELESYDDDMNHISSHFSKTTTATNMASNRELLIPDRCTNDTIALEQFSRVFHARYSSTGPILYIGSLDEAIKDSLFTSINERRPLAIYLHNDRSVCANVFCAQVLASETTIEYLANNYVVWAWDVTTDANRTRLLETFKRCVGPQYAQRIATMEKDAFPLILIVTRSRGSLEVISFIEGKSTPSEALLTLIQSHDLYEQQKKRDAEQEVSREIRENIIKQQEDEYNRSLQADLAKEKARLADEQRQKEEKETNERLQKQKLQEQEICKARLPTEPNDTEKDITRLKIRLPQDEGILLRRFRIKETLQTLFDYLTTEGRMFGEYKLLSAYPKRDLTQLNRLDTFEQLKLYPQEQLILEIL